MDAGRELDSLVADRVMGWKVFAGEPGYGRPPNKPISLVLDPIPAYSTDIAAAWTVVEKMRNPDFRLNRDGDWVCWFGGLYSFGAEADTAPLAICLAALKAVGVEV